MDIYFVLIIIILFCVFFYILFYIKSHKPKKIVISKDIIFQKYKTNMQNSLQHVSKNDYENKKLQLIKNIAKQLEFNVIIDIDDKKQIIKRLIDTDFTE